MNGQRVLWDKGLLKYRFDVDTKGDDFLDNDEHLTFELVADRGGHPIWYVDSDGYCELVHELVG